MKWWAAPIAFSLLVGGCADFPKDSSGTLVRAQGGAFTVGWTEAATGDPRLRRLVARLSERLRARPAAVSGPAEPLLLRLEQGEVDLVVGVFDEKSPWRDRVTFSRPLATEAMGDGELQAVAATRNGEHAWSMEVDRAVNDLTEPGP